MGNLGRFLEFSIRTGDILESRGFYKMLGFEELEIGDVWPHKYTVLTDGICCIGLHDAHFDGPAITFVQQDLAKRARRMTDAGFDFKAMQLDEDSFNELGLDDSDGHRLTLLEARTFTGGSEYDNDSVCGSWFELSLPVRNVIHSGRFWASVAPRMLEFREEPTTHMRFDAGGAPIGLSESIALPGPSLCFRCHDKDALLEHVERYGLRCQKYPGYEGAFLALTAPEGTALFMFDEDFLGESYQVEESAEPAAYLD